MKTPIYQVDAFTSEVFGGNPAAVCPLDEWLPDDIMQKIGNENNLSETAFFVKKNNHFEIRWFTPAVEIDLCGHATLASAHVLFNHLNYDKNKILFQSKSGELKVFKNEGLITLDFPAADITSSIIKKELNESLGKFPVALYKSRNNLLVVYEKEEDILEIQPDFEKLKQLDCHGVIITAKGNEVDFVSRFFAPAIGINEDPVTGSAHTTLIPFWSQTLGKQKLHAYQLSDRKGELFCENKEARVWISGNAVTFFEGTIGIEI